MSKITRVFEGTVRDALHARQQELRKKSGLPHPDYYKELGKSYDIENDQERYAKQSEIRKKYGIKEDVEALDESAARFIQKVNQAVNAAASGKHKNAQMHLDNARTFMLGVKSTDMEKIKDAHAAYKNLRNKYAGTGGNYKIKDDMVGVAKVIHNEETQIAEGYAEEDIANGGTVIFKHNGKHVMSKVTHKTGGGAATKIHTTSKHVVPLHHVVSTDASDWSRFKDATVKEETQIDEADEFTHRVQVTVSEPDHPMVSRRKETQQKFVRVGGSKEEAVNRAKAHYKKQGYKVHGAEYVSSHKKVSEEHQIDEISNATKASYTAKAKEQIKQTEPFTKKGEYKDIAKNFISKRQRGIAKANEETDVMSPAETYKKLAVKHLRDSMNKNATQKQRDYAKKMNKRALEASKMDNHTDALNHYRGMSEQMAEPATGMHKMLDKQKQVEASPEPDKGAEKTFTKFRAGLKK